NNKNFIKRYYTFKKNSSKVHLAYRAKIYICIRCKGEKYNFKFTNKALLLLEEE
ncbi:hypothetical protein B0T10DRAFT_372799, partial [Thelonectria olida]